jgi:hypothetical protein
MKIHKWLPIHVRSLQVVKGLGRNCTSYSSLTRCANEELSCLDGILICSYLHWVVWLHTLWYVCAHSLLPSAKLMLWWFVPSTSTTIPNIALHQCLFWRGSISGEKFLPERYTTCWSRSKQDRYYSP